MKCNIIRRFIKEITIKLSALDSIIVINWINKNNIEKERIGLLINNLFINSVPSYLGYIHIILDNFFY